MDVLWIDEPRPDDIDKQVNRAYLGFDVIEDTNWLMFGVLIYPDNEFLDRDR